MPTIPDSRINYQVEGYSLTMPYFRNIPLGDVSEQIKTAIISIHGDGRNAEEHYELLMTLSSQAGAVDSTIILAPLYCIQSDIDNYSLDSTTLFWPNSDWNAGDLSRSTASNPRPSQISAFSIIDSILHRLVENNINLEKIIITGHSAGSQLVVRYAAGGRAQNHIVEEREIDFLYVPTNTPSFLYMDSLRVVNEALQPYQFEYPFSCGTSNYYKYGLNNLNEYMEQTGVANIRNNYSERKIIYLIGEYDIGGQSNNCARDVQGEHRLLRSYIFFSYLGLFYGESIYQKQYLAEIPIAYHDFEDMVFSDCGLPIYFNGESLNCQFIDPVVLNNFNPVADAGEDQIVGINSVVLLDGSNSTDPDGNLISYEWAQTQGIPVTMDSLSQDSLFFVAPGQSTNLRFVLTVVDNLGFSSQDTANIEVSDLLIEEEKNQGENFGVSPNPFNSVVTIITTKNFSDLINAKVYNLLGVEVKDLSVQLLHKQSPTVITWDATDFRGKTLNSGVYFISIKTKTNTIVKKTTYLK